MSKSGEDSASGVAGDRDRTGSSAVVATEPCRRGLQSGWQVRRRRPGVRSSQEEPCGAEWRLEGQLQRKVGSRKGVLEVADTEAC